MKAIRGALAFLACLVLVPVLGALTFAAWFALLLFIAFCAFAVAVASRGRP